ncbi:hypothetical protein ACFCZ1_14250 [Streptomyces sp. NPDC056224]|uniref:hypothetical protein n=1 Tax=Streptomyces sp. NPDC056224 TaxID=3345750 RepID=UPI0035D6221D
MAVPSSSHAPTAGRHVLLAAPEMVNGAYYGRDEHVAPAACATEERTVRRLNKLAGLLVGRDA